MDDSPGAENAITTPNDLSTQSDGRATGPQANGPAGAKGDLEDRLKLPGSGGIVGWFQSHPVGFWFFFWGEFAERASYYGMRAILTLYMADQLGFGKANAATIMSFFIAGCYFLPLLGGFVADRYFGKYWTIVGFSIPYILGHVILGVEDQYFLFTALVLLAMGTGVIKPNISTLMGNTYDLYRPGQTRLRSEAFAMFYFSINVGAFLSQFAMPTIRTHWGYSIAFLFPAALMVFAFAIFAAGKRFYAPDLIGHEEKTPEEKHQQWSVLRRLALLFLLITFFWAIFDQSATTWIYFAKEQLDLNILGMTVDPDQIQALNPLFIMIFLPIITAFWSYLDIRGIKVRPTDKILVGFILTAITMGIHAVAAGISGASGTKVSLWWQVIAYLVLTWAEILISVTGLELAFAAAPKSMKGFITACWLVTVAIANLVINAPLTRLYPSDEPGWHFPSATSYFGALTALMVVVSVAFVFVAIRFNRGMAAWQAEEHARPKEFTATIRPSAMASEAIKEAQPGNFAQDRNL
jgi:POT family proton-dependent oligopeptide transporter